MFLAGMGENHQIVGEILPEMNCKHASSQDRRLLRGEEEVGSSHSEEVKDEPARSGHAIIQRIVTVPFNNLNLSSYCLYDSIKGGYTI